jgi:hypothetical protein
MEKDKSLQKRSFRNWLEIDRENTAFCMMKMIPGMSFIGRAAAPRL